MSESVKPARVDRTSSKTYEDVCRERDALLAERDAALDRARRAEETRENANAVSVRVELENRRLVAERDALRGAGKQINHHLERAKVFLDSERYATCGQEIAGAHAALLAAWRAATGEG